MKIGLESVLSYPGMGSKWNQSEESKQKIREAKLAQYKDHWVDVKCGYCSEEYRVTKVRIADGRGKFCSRKCKGLASKGVRIAPETEFKPGHKTWNKGITGEDSHVFGQSHPMPKAEKSASWKGDNITSYQHLHRWIRSTYGKPSKCDDCGISDSRKRYEWANISGEYRRDISDYKRLCRSCHTVFDIENPKRPQKRFSLPWT